MGVELANYLTALNQFGLTAQIDVKLLKSFMDFNAQVNSEIIQKLSGVELNNNPTNTGQLLDIRA